MYGVSNSLFKWTRVASGYRCKAIFKMSQSFGLDQMTYQICVKDNTWATRSCDSPLVCLSEECRTPFMIFSVTCVIVSLTLF
jgi:hypothetical protein